MSKLGDEIILGLMQAVEIEKGDIPLEEREGMPAKTYYTKDANLVGEMVKLRKEKGVTQKELAQITGNKQQVLSRIERMETNPSIRVFNNILDALGYELRIVKKKSI